jgi:zinc protease
MKYHIKQSESYSLATIQKKDHPTLSAIISIDLHTENSLNAQATELIYSDALISGNSKYSRDEFLSAVNLLGADISLSIANSVLNISLKSRAKNFPKLLKLFELMITTPTFKKEELVRIKSTTINSLHDAKEDSKTEARIGLINSLYEKGDRRYTYEIDDTIKEVGNISAKELKTLHGKVISNTWTCSVAGSAENCLALDKLILRIKPAIKKATSKPINQQRNPSQNLVLKNIPGRANIDFSIGYSLPITIHHPDYIPLSFGLSVLGIPGGFAGRLMSTVRELEGLTYTIYGQLEGFSGNEQGYWRIMTFFAPDKSVQGINSTLRELRKLHSKGITANELSKFKTIINTKRALLQDSIGGLLNELHNYHCNGFTLEEMKIYKAKVGKLTQAEVNKAIKEHLKPSNIIISGAGPIKSVVEDLKQIIKTV